MAHFPKLFLFLFLLVTMACGDALSDEDSTPAATNTAANAPADTPTVDSTTTDQPTSTADTPTTAPESTAADLPTSATNTPASADTPEPQPTNTAVASPIPLRPLADEWYIDSDGNVIPDFLEIQLNYDPLADDCAPAACSMATASGGSALSQEQNILLLLDASGSMAEPAGNQSKMEIAKEAIMDYVAATSPIANLGFMVFGHQGDGTEAGKPASCAGIELLSPLGDLTTDNVGDILAQFEPVGWTPIAATLEAAESAFPVGQPANNKIILVTDGLETCAGDPIAVATRLHNSGQVQLVIDVIGLGVQSQDEAAQLAQIAEAGGGVYFDAQTREDIRDYFEQSAREVFERFGFAVCIVENSVNYSLCSGQMVLSVTTAAQSYQLQATDDRQRDAYRDFLDQMRAAKEESDQQYDDFRNNLEQLLLQRDELEQLQEELFGEE